MNNYTVTLTNKTIKRILDVIRSDRDVTEEQREAEQTFKQGDCEIYVTYKIYGKLVEEYIIHDECMYDRTEDISHYEYDFTEIESICAYCNDGADDVTVSNSESITRARL